MISNVVVAGNEAVLSWSAGKLHGIMGLMRRLDRWWDGFDSSGAQTPRGIAESLEFAGFSRELIAAASAHDALPKWQSSTHGTSSHPANNLMLASAGGTAWTSPQDTAGYELTIAYAANDAPADSTFTQIYGRAPTQAEMLPNPLPPRGWGGPNSVFFFDITVGGRRTVTFAPGTKIDVWFPFVLDDQVRYELGFMSGGKSTGPVSGTIFDNVLHFELPSFSLTPGSTLMGEIDGDG